ncbi:hypothetical protein BLNAU_4518 [Blattamonas nauphoetae]|uniref:Phorbol-ester/DAG-type domain-containing protein n=1 Tax=Blattamonas nauphoetae TaxID=2049346 RepID=A0ABQ9YA98_9EUKA|nr:hypothetical protein BLNAU_4518 [Blattamonas nauphoetae]
MKSDSPALNQESLEPFDDDSGFQWINTTVETIDVEGGSGPQSIQKRNITFDDDSSDLHEPTKQHVVREKRVVKPRRTRRLRLKICGWNSQQQAELMFIFESNESGLLLIPTEQDEHKPEPDESLNESSHPSSSEESSVLSDWEEPIDVDAEYSKMAQERRQKLAEERKQKLLDAQSKGTTPQHSTRASLVKAASSTMYSNLLAPRPSHIPTTPQKKTLPTGVVMVYEEEQDADHQEELIEFQDSEGELGNFEQDEEKRLVGGKGKSDVSDDSGESIESLSEVDSSHQLTLRQKQTQKTPQPGFSFTLPSASSLETKKQNATPTSHSGKHQSKLRFEDESDDAQSSPEDGSEFVIEIESSSIDTTKRKCRKSDPYDFEQTSDSEDEFTDEESSYGRKVARKRPIVKPTRRSSRLAIRAEAEMEHLQELGKQQRKHALLEKVNTTFGIKLGDDKRSRRIASDLGERLLDGDFVDNLSPTTHRMTRGAKKQQESDIRSAINFLTREAMEREDETSDSYESVTCSSTGSNAAIISDMSADSDGILAFLAAEDRKLDKVKPKKQRTFRLKKKPPRKKEVDELMEEARTMNNVIEAPMPPPKCLYCQNTKGKMVPCSLCGEMLHAWCVSASDDGNLLSSGGSVFPSHSPSLSSTPIVPSEETVQPEQMLRDQDEPPHTTPTAESHHPSTPAVYCHHCRAHLALTQSLPPDLIGTSYPLDSAGRVQNSTYHCLEPAEKLDLLLLLSDLAVSSQPIAVLVANACNSEVRRLSELRTQIELLNERIFEMVKNEIEIDNRIAEILKTLSETTTQSPETPLSQKLYRDTLSESDSDGEVQTLARNRERQQLQTDLDECERSKEEAKTTIALCQSEITQHNAVLRSISTPPQFGQVTLGSLSLSSSPLGFDSIGRTFFSFGFDPEHIFVFDGGMSLLESAPDKKNDGKLPKLEPMRVFGWGMMDQTLESVQKVRADGTKVDIVEILESDSDVPIKPKKPRKRHKKVHRTDTVPTPVYPPITSPTFWPTPQLAPDVPNDHYSNVLSFTPLITLTTMLPATHVIDPLFVDHDTVVWDDDGSVEEIGFSSNLISSGDGRKIIQKSDPSYETERSHVKQIEQKKLTSLMKQMFQEDFKEKIRDIRHAQISAETDNEPIPHGLSFSKRTIHRDLLNFVSMVMDQVPFKKIPLNLYFPLLLLPKAPKSLYFTEQIQLALKEPTIFMNNRHLCDDFTISPIVNNVIYDILVWREKERQNRLLELLAKEEADMSDNQRRQRHLTHPLQFPAPKTQWKAQVPSTKSHTRPPPPTTNSEEPIVISGDDLSPPLRSKKQSLLNPSSFHSRCHIHRDHHLKPRTRFRWSHSRTLRLEQCSLPTTSHCLSNPLRQTHLHLITHNPLHLYRRLNHPTAGLSHHHHFPHRLPQSLSQNLLPPHLRNLNLNFHIIISSSTGRRDPIYPIFILMNFVDDVKRSMNFLIHIIISLLCYCFTWIGGVIHAALLYFNIINSMC